MEIKTIDDFISNYTNEGTRSSYKSHLYNYFVYHKYLKKLNTVPYVSYKILKNPDTYIKNGRDYQKDIEEWWKNDYATRPPNTRVQGLSAIKMYLMENGIEFKSFFWKKLLRRSKGKGAITKDKIPTQQELKEIMQHCKSIVSKSLFMTLATSGMRINEAISITIDDIDLDKKPARINIPAHLTKSGEKRITFITEETKNVLKEYKENYREKYLKYAAKKSSYYNKKKKDDRLFPMTYNTANLMWKNMVKNAGKDERDKITRIHKFHIHCLRKFFRSRMGNKNGIGVDMTEFLMGHEGYLTKEYRHYTEEELGQEYLKGADRLLIFETPADTSDIRDQLQQRNREMQEMRDTINELKAQITELRLEKLEKANGLKQ